tara:strand:- start:316 stop:501 length:186 start_codon:yes stop_codon:yes gene_type:complete
VAQVNIDGKDYEFESLSEKAQANVLSLQFVQAELKKFEAQTAVFKTAESAYLKSLKDEIES